MKITTQKKVTHAQRQKEYRETHPLYRKRDNARRSKGRATAPPLFIGVDCEGIGKGKNHRAVLISAYDKNGNGAEHTAKDLTRGLHWEEVFDFLYGIFQRNPKAAFVGFYLGYDFNQALRSLPIEAARSLLSKEGRAARRIHSKGVKRRQYNSVKVGRWEIDMLGFKRLSIRPRPEGCTCYEQATKCGHKQMPWMHLCDSGSFYQMSLLAVLDEKRWTHDPNGRPCTDKEYATILTGKNRRSVAKLDDDMKFYNKLENMILCRVMERLAEGFQKIGIRLAKDQWYGPGASASKWLNQNKIVKRDQLTQLMPDWFIEHCHNSYFGGWFEIFSHGLIPGCSYNYDINNAYPFAATKLPHICKECLYHRGEGAYRGTSKFVLLYATVFTRGDRIGAVPYRDKKGSILRPGVSKGWYWQGEIQAATQAGLVKKVITHEWNEIVPCNHPKPFTDLERLYNLRLEVGKAGAQGMAIKLLANSLYGKVAQSVGSAPFNNWFYASYITSHCRTQILDAIATHPNHDDSVLMVATDGICFDSPHPTLSVSTRLGDWEHTEYSELCLFKPGVYWHREGKEALLKVKSRGVPKQEFMNAIEGVERQFELMHNEGQFPGRLIVKEAFEAGIDLAYLRSEKGWPHFWVPVKFRMKSCKQALNEGKWDHAGEVQEEIWIKQDSDPESKRRHPRYNYAKRRIDTSIHSLSTREIQTIYHGEIRYPSGMDLGFGLDGETAFAPILEATNTLRDKPANYDLPINDENWERVWG